MGIQNQGAITRRSTANVGLVLALLLGRSALGASCSELSAATLEGATITEAGSVSGPVSVSYYGFLPSTVTLPAFCRIKGVAAKTVRFEVWLPEAQWNGRLLSLGNGGFGGAISTAGLADALSKGYAVTANDTGHSGAGREWMRDPVLVRHWGHDATHLVTGPAKTLIKAFYGQPQKFAYFDGCSTGGGQAMEEAEFYPSDYDGIVAGAPGMGYTHLMLSFLWGLKVTEQAGAKIPPEGLKVLHDAAMAACDAADGVKDGLIENPLACHFDPAVVACKDGQTSGCLTEAQVQTVRLIYQGPRNPRTGEQIYPGFVPGSEADPSSKPSPGNPANFGWGGIQGPLGQTFALPLLREMAYHDPNWDWHSFDWDKDVADLDRRISADITAMSPDLRPFQSHGAKLIMYQGWDDPLDGPTLEIGYRSDVIAVFAGASHDRTSAEAAVDGFMRVFMVPGMGHCFGGPGPSKFDALAALRAWVEDKTPPERLIATIGMFPGQDAGGKKEMSRPLCPYPQVAHWDGRGDTNAADSFRCVSAQQPQ